MTLQGCHTYNVETEQIKRLMQNENMPFISIETIIQHQIQHN